MDEIRSQCNPVYQRCGELPLCTRNWSIGRDPLRVVGADLSILPVTSMVTAKLGGRQLAVRHARISAEAAISMDRVR